MPILYTFSKVNTALNRPAVVPDAIEEVDVGSSELLAPHGVDEEVEAVLQPVDAEEGQVEVRVLGVGIDNVADGDGAHAEEVAERDQQEGPGHPHLPVLYLALHLHINTEMHKYSRSQFNVHETLVCLESSPVLFEKPGRMFDITPYEEVAYNNDDTWNGKCNSIVEPVGINFISIDLLNEVTLPTSAIVAKVTNNLKDI